MSEYLSNPINIHTFSSILILFCGFRSGGVRDAQTRANISIFDPGVVKTVKETNTSHYVSQKRQQKRPTKNAILPPQYLEIKNFQYRIIYQKMHSSALLDLANL